LTNCKFQSFLKAIHIFISFGRRIDDPIGACSVHLVGGIWGQISVALFAQNPTSTNGHLGLFMGMTFDLSQMLRLLIVSSTGGGFHMLKVQGFSVICLFLWGFIITYPILWFVNRITKIRLDPADEVRGCDIIEHYMGDEDDLKMLMPMENIKLSNVMSGPQVCFNITAAGQLNNADSYKQFDTLGRRRVYSTSQQHTNAAYEPEQHHQADPSNRL